MGSSCPFCRKSFVASRIIKLHVNRPPTLEQGVEDVELLQRLDAEEAKRQVELEAAMEQSKQRKRVLRESLERAQRLQKQREEEAEARQQQPPSTVAGTSASGAVPSPREIRIDEVPRFFNESSVTRPVGAAAPPSTRRGRGGGGWRARRDADADLTSPSVMSSAAPPPTQWDRGEGGGWRARWGAVANLTSPFVSSAAPPSTRWGQGEGGGWRTRRWDIDADPASSTHALLEVDTFLWVPSREPSPLRRR